MIWVALLRGINVGGNRIIKMAELKQLFEAEGCTNVRTYIQSGNLVFESTLRSPKKLNQRLSDAIESQFGFRPPLLLLRAAALSQAIEQNPFSAAVADASQLHFFFLYGRPVIDEVRLAALAAETETYQLIGDVFYLHTPEGLAKSKLAAAVERQLGVTVTARNFATVQKLMALVLGDA